ncbi:hypothetical protein [Legionella maioricensis]|uniref:Uncharacterized protein n=1 Tax=Legionella maioricensis TaxID=2896528 RepID=A0A9X2D2L8_9GAMM|nr:hypothetical protein [Legionella maioricensis]MCL9685098.1 hypothetical protein [Legionella maioricensis]MCL9688141.1 hypothetical protein [Legionella maioricensis]
MKINFIFISDTLSHWGLASFLRLEAIEFVLDNSVGDQITESLLMRAFSSEEDEPVAHLDDSQAGQQFKTIIIDGDGYRMDFLKEERVKRIIHELSSNQNLSINDALTEKADPDISIFKNYMAGLSAVLKGYKKQYIPNDLLYPLSADWLDASNRIQELLKTPDLVSIKECTRLHEVLIRHLEKLHQILGRLEEEHPLLEGDNLSLKQGYSASFEVSRLGINLFKAAAISCIKKLTQCINQLTPAYYANTIPHYTSKFADLLTLIPGHDEEKRLFIQTIYSKFALPSSDLTELKTASAIYVTFNRIEEILTLMSTHHVLNEVHFKTLERIMLLPAEEANKKLIQLRDQITSLEQLDLLMPETLSSLLTTDSLIDKSCSARTSVTSYVFFGTASRDEDSYKRMWSVYSLGVEQKLIKMLKEHKSLSELLNFAAQTRQTIAISRKESVSFFQFGGERKGVSNQDIYTNNHQSIINASLFPAVSQIACQEYDYPAMVSSDVLKESPPDAIFEINNVYKLSLQLDRAKIDLPDEEIRTTLKKSKKSSLKPTKIAIKFSPLDRNKFEQMLSFFDTHFLAKCRKKEYTEEEFLTELGKLIFYLVRSYPYIRGTGAILQWEARSLVSYYTDGQVDLGDIRLGRNSDNSKNLPYDVYAHLVQNPEAYAEAFKKALLPAFTAQNEPSHSARLSS